MARRRSTRVAIGLLVLGLVLVVAYFYSSNTITPRASSRYFPDKIEGYPSQPGGAPSWVKVRYDDLIDRGKYTHSGRTVGEILEELDKSSANIPERVFSDLQPSLEPFSFVCNDIVTAGRPSDQIPYINVIADYPSGSRQPAWAALFREGHYQLFVGDGRARLFLKGENPARLLDQQKGVIRHPLKGVLESAGIDKMIVEVYAFNNDYALRTINLDLNPYVVNISLEQLTSSKKDLPLPEVSEFIDQEVELEAAEVGKNGDFFLYGTPSSSQTIAGSPQSIEDFAVVYRSIFHYGRNAPYISLDRHEDNRYAKVNFGGLLEDTRVGSVVLEADKLFKTMSTGLDPNTRKFIKNKIRAVVPDFATSAERGIRDDETGITEIRYWFYPDKIQTVTDGHLGVVQNFQFLADAERMDKKVALGHAQRETIDHLNKYFPLYARALTTYQELNTVGRMMAIVNWLKQSGAAEQLDLDSLLLVELSAFQTPRRTKKLLAVTAEVSTDDGLNDETGVRRKVYCLDSLLEGLQPSIGDKEIIKIAQKRFSEIEDPDLIPPSIRGKYATMEFDEKRIDKMQVKLRSLGSMIERERTILDRSDEYKINRFNSMVEEYNWLKERYNGAVDSYNQSVRGMRHADLKTYTLTSVGGGINLRPKDFAKPLRMPDSPLIKRIRNSREIIRSSAPRGGITRSASRKISDASLSKLSPSPWKIDAEQAIDGSTKKHWVNGGQGSMTVETNTPSGYTRYRVTKKNYFSDTIVMSNRNKAVISNSSFPNGIVATGKFSQGGTIVLRKGKISGINKITGGIE